MHGHDFDAVVYDCDVCCVACLPDGLTADSTDEWGEPIVHPIFATEEMDSYPVCCECGAEHDYVSLTEQGQRDLIERAGPQDEDITTEDYVTWMSWDGPVATVGPEEDWRDVLEDWCEEEGFWPNFWHVSDHGNATLLTLAD
jgi:hypothetical protein